MKVQVVTNNISFVIKFYFAISIIYNNDKKEVVTIILLLVTKKYLSLISTYFISIFKIVTNAHSSQVVNIIKVFMTKRKNEFVINIIFY